MSFRLYDKGENYEQFLLYQVLSALDYAMIIAPYIFIVNKKFLKNEKFIRNNTNIVKFLTKMRYIIKIFVTFVKN